VFKNNLPFVKLIIGILGFSVIYFQLNKKFSVSDLYLIKEKISQTEMLQLFVLCCCMMPLNWLSETFKWHYLVNKIAPYNFKQSLKATLAGIYFGNFLPYRLGDLGGRLVYLEKANVLQGLMLYTAGGIAQVYISLLAGLFPLLSSMETLKSFLSPSLIIALCILLVILFPWLMKTLPTIFNQLKKIKWFKALATPQIFALSNSSLIITVLLSLLRYGIYLSQFVMLCIIFGVSEQLGDLYLKSALMFLLFAFVPSFFATEWLTRVSIALLVFGNTYALAITIAASLLWLINILVPSLIGYLVILTYKLKPVRIS
jgi:hypothetical protein